MTVIIIVVIVNSKNMTKSLFSLYSNKSKYLFP